MEERARRPTPDEPSPLAGEASSAAEEQRAHQEQRAHEEQRAREARTAEAAERIAGLLPGVLRRARSPARDDLLCALLGEMAELHLGRVQVLDELDAHFDPRRAPLESLLFLAYWVDLEPLIAPDEPPGLGWLRREDRGQVLQAGFPAGVERLRALVADAVSLTLQRGTSAGLARFLETATGVAGFAVAESAGRPFHIQVVCPDGDASYRAFVSRIVEYQKPAYLTYELCWQAAAKSE
jgi:hypothetical protein